MRLHAFLLAVCVCIHHTRAASIALLDNKFNLDNVDLDDEQVNVVKEENLRITDQVIPVKVVEEPVIDENSNDYVPPFDTNIMVKRVEVDLTNPGPPQRQEHETQNPENFSDNDKILVSIKNTIEQAENVFKEGLKGVSDSFKTFLQANEDLPAIHQNINHLKETFTDQIEKLNATISRYIQPQTSLSSAKANNQKLEIVQTRLKFLDHNFKLGIGTLTEGVEIYSIIKEEDEAEKAIALKADVKAEPDVAPSNSAGAPAKPDDKPAPANPAPPNNQPPVNTPFGPLTVFLNNFSNSVSTAFNDFTTSVSNTFTGNNNANNQAQPSFPNLFQGLPNIFQGQNTAGQAQIPPSQEISKPTNAQADPAPTPAPPAPWTYIIQSVTSTWNNLLNPGQNNQQPQQQQEQQNNPPPPANTNPFQQAIQNMVSFITPQPPQPQKPDQPVNPSLPAAAAAPEKAPESAPTKQDVVIHGSNVVPAPVNEKPQEQTLPSQDSPVPAQAGPIQQMVQNNPIIKGIQSAVQRIQGTPNPETPREEIVQENAKDEVEDSKGHYNGGHWPENNVTHQGDSNNSSRIEDYVEAEKEQYTPLEEKEVLKEQLKPEELKTPVADKTE